MTIAPHLHTVQAVTLRVVHGESLRDLSLEALDCVALKCVHASAGCTVIMLKNVVSILQITHERPDRVVTVGYVVVVTGKTICARCPIPAVHAFRISEDDRDVEVSALAQRFKMVIDFSEQDIFINNFARHSGIHKVSRGIVA